jgi:hypothetical protein
MSERGSFTTEYIYCDRCFNIVKKVLLKRDKFLCSTIIPSWCKQRLPIVAGKIGGLYAGEELNDMELEYIPELEKRLCHEVRIAVLAENGERLFKARAAENQGAEPVQPTTHAAQKFCSWLWKWIVGKTIGRA